MEETYHQNNTSTWIMLIAIGLLSLSWLVLPALQIENMKKDMETIQSNLRTIEGSRVAQK